MMKTATQNRNSTWPSSSLSVIFFHIPPSLVAGFSYKLSFYAGLCQIYTYGQKPSELMFHSATA
jgi:hypothetical protein